MAVVGKHILTGKNVEMTRRRDGKLLFMVVGYDGPPAGGIVLEIDPRKLKGAFGPQGIVVPPVKEAVLTHRECGCPIAASDGTILRCVCPPLIEHAFVAAREGMAHLPNERCCQCSAPRAQHQDWRCEPHGNVIPCIICHPVKKE